MLNILLYINYAHTCIYKLTYLNKIVYYYISQVKIQSYERMCSNKYNTETVRQVIESTFTIDISVGNSTNFIFRLFGYSAPPLWNN